MPAEFAHKAHKAHKTTLTIFTRIHQIQQNFWKVINIFQPSSINNHVISLRRIVLLTNPTDIANALNKYFVGCATNLLAKCIPNYKQSPMWEIPYSPTLSQHCPQFSICPNICRGDFTRAPQIKTKQPMWT
ncbi:hypothetical protein FKM82_023191 [Ascaphus truei]